jgi:2-haloacid dehalogenase
MTGSPMTRDLAMNALPAALPRITTVVFDAYGTLFDVHSAVNRHAARIGPQAQPFSDMWRSKQLEYTWVRSLMGDYRDFWVLTKQALDYCLAKFPGVDPALKPDLLAAYRTLSAYPEVPSVLARLRAGGLKTAILSNGSPRMLDEAVTSAGIGGLLDRVISVEDAHIFKTAPATYELVLSTFQILREDVLFVSSNRWDVAGAASFGFTPVWVNRAGNPSEYDDFPPAATVVDLNGVG